VFLLGVQRAARSCRQNPQLKPKGKTELMRRLAMAVPPPSRLPIFPIEGNSISEFLKGIIHYRAGQSKAEIDAFRMVIFGLLSRHAVPVHLAGK
jgi:hypothetical protein